MIQKWEGDIPSIVSRFGLSPDEFQGQLGTIDVPKLIRDKCSMISLVDMHTIKSIIPLRMEVLETIIKAIPTSDGQFPYSSAKIKLVKVDPFQVMTGQRFVFREKYESIIEGLGNFFSDFAINSEGIGNLGAYFVRGKTSEGRQVLGCYLPPIIERHGSNLVILDGVHRSYVSRQVGLTPISILIENISVDFPCECRGWSQVEVISIQNRPKNMEDRFFGALKPCLFRDLKLIGVDG